MGGLYERIIQEIKKCVRRTVGHKTFLTVGEMRTFLTKVESVINCRPLTFFSDADVDRPLRPIDFLLHGGEEMDTELANPLPDTDDTNDPDFVAPNDRNTALQNWKRLSSALENFWRDWQSNYLLSLRERKCQASAKNQFLPKIGEVVLIENELCY